MIDRRMVHALEVERIRRSDMGADLDGVHAIFQTSTLDAMLDGRYDGDVTFADLQARGDLGLGTLDALDGEMIGVDGHFYSAAVDGSLREVAPDERTPFASTGPFRVCSPGPYLASTVPTRRSPRP